MFHKASVNIHIGHLVQHPSRTAFRAICAENPQSLNLFLASIQSHVRGEHQQESDITVQKRSLYDILLDFVRSADQHAGSGVFSSDELS